MKRTLIAAAIFLTTYAVAYWWGVYDLRTNPPKIENDGDLATLGMMPVFLHIYGIAWAIFVAVCYGISLFIKAIVLRSKSKLISNEKTI
jgi:hypothetical protein